MVAPPAVPYIFGNPGRRVCIFTGIKEETKQVESQNVIKLIDFAEVRVHQSGTVPKLKRLNIKDLFCCNW